MSWQAIKFSDKGTRRSKLILKEKSNLSPLCVRDPQRRSFGPRANLEGKLCQRQVAHFFEGVLIKFGRQAWLCTWSIPASHPTSSLGRSPTRNQLVNLVFSPNFSLVRASTVHLHPRPVAPGIVSNNVCWGSKKIANKMRSRFEQASNNLIIIQKLSEDESGTVLFGK